MVRLFRVGAYVLEDESKAAVVLVGTGSEVALAVEAAKLLRTEGMLVRSVWLVCFLLVCRDIAMFLHGSRVRLGQPLHIQYQSHLTG